MSRSIHASKNIQASKSTQKKMGRPATTGPGLQVVVRLHEPILSGLDEWCFEQPDRPSRAEGMRRLTGYALQVLGKLSKASRPADDAAAAPASDSKPVPAAKPLSPKKARPQRS
jgi:hypothetical protein